MDKIVRFVECLIPMSVCNFKCEYCYVIQQNRDKQEMNKLENCMKHLSRAFNKERWGGVCYFSLCAIGETLLVPAIVDIIEQLLKDGHYVNVTTNGTINQRFDEILKIDHVYLKKLNISFSLHYDELIRTNKMNDFIKNVKKMINSETSVLVQINLCDSYISKIDSIKDMCLMEFGELPHVALTREEVKGSFKIYTDSEETYLKTCKDMNSKLFEFTEKQFNKRIKTFCYAGDWSFILDIESGTLNSCYGCKSHYNIYHDIDRKIKKKVIGRCSSKYCVNSSHFLSLGVSPDYTAPTYYELRARPKTEWHKETIRYALDSKLQFSNNRYSKTKEYRIMLIKCLRTPCIFAKNKFKVLVRR